MQISFSKLMKPVIVVLIGSFALTIRILLDCRDSRFARLPTKITLSGFAVPSNRMTITTNGAYILWERPGSGGGDPSRNQGWIIDTTPESPAERQDAGISLGRTYSDLTAQVHITPIEVGGTSPDEYLDVVVNYGEFAGNNAPTVSITAPGTGNAREAIEFSASGNDGDGDTVVYSWDLGNGDVYPSTSSISASFTVGGTYTVAVTVTDMKGGTETKTAQVVIDDPVNTWSNRTSGTGDNLTATAANSTHVMVGGQSILLRSSDGQSWTNVTPSSANNVAFNDIVWAGSEFVAVGRDAEFQNNSFFGWKPVVYTSPDGSSWTEEFAGACLCWRISLRF